MSVQLRRNPHPQPKFLKECQSAIEKVTYSLVASAMGAGCPPGGELMQSANPTRIMVGRMTPTPPNPAIVLMQGPAAWNAWRKANDPPPGDPRWSQLFHDLRYANLSNADLTNADLSNCDLKSANLTEAKFAKVQLRREGGLPADLRRVNLHKAIIDATDFSNIDLTGAIFTEAIVTKSQFAGAELFYADFTDARLLHANFEGARCRSAKFKGAANLFKAKMMRVELNKADLTGADLTQADLTRADLTQADLTSATLKDTHFAEAITKRTIFTHALIENVHDLRFDSSLTRGAVYPTRPHDPWSLLRRNYTGSHLLFHLLFLIATLLPYVARTAGWLLVNRGQTAIAEQQKKLQQFIDEQKQKPETERGVRIGSTGITVSVDEKTLQHFATIQPCLGAKCQETQVWKILLGLDKPFPFWLLPLCSGLWGIMRGVLILELTPLGDLEDRTGFSPAWEGKYGYRWLYYLHLASWVPWLGAISSLIYELWSWLGSSVWLPSLS
jgi:uncharacterized protein YjbI with pentapeptide repeats